MTLLDYRILYLQAITKHITHYFLRKQVYLIGICLSTIEESNLADGGISFP